MTREEAITKTFKEYGVPTSNPFFFEILKVLEQEPCEDCISRAELIDKTIKRNSIWLKVTDSRGMNLQEIIDELSSVQPKPKTGHWTALESRFELGDRLKCSECGQVFVVGNKVSRNYCPNCGAKMESEDKE